MSSYILETVRRFAEQHTEMTNSHLALAVSQEFNLTYAMAQAIVESL